MMTLESVPSDDLQPARMGEISRITAVFVQPRKAFSDIAARPRGLVPLLLLIVSGIALNLMTSPKGISRIMVERQTENNPQVQQQPVDRRDQLVALAPKFFTVMSYLTAIPSTLLAIAVLAWGITSSILSAPLRFGQVFAIVTYAELPRLLQGVLTAIVVRRTNAADINVQNPLASNLGAFMDPRTTSEFTYTLASGLDLFSLYVALLMAVGLKAAAGNKISFGGALFAAISAWVLMVLLNAACVNLNK